ncbi:MAG: rod shape-determining protein MreD [Alphaproteobacteria bacterium]|nr:rod shape-determining protein MreD [Alphaproteobacteria bacterium]
MERSGLFVTPLSSVIPALIGLLVVVLANLPVEPLGGWFPVPLFALMPVYFWGLVRPDLMPPAVAFGLGVLQDLLSGGPPGIWAAAFVAAYALLDTQRDSFAGLSGLGAILGFGLSMVVAGLTAYFVSAFYYWQLPPMMPLLLEIVASIVFYIPVALLFGVVHRRLVGARRGDL